MSFRKWEGSFFLFLIVDDIWDYRLYLYIYIISVHCLFSSKKKEERRNDFCFFFTCAYFFFFLHGGLDESKGCVGALAAVAGWEKVFLGFFF